MRVRQLRCKSPTFPARGALVFMEDPAAGRYRKPSSGIEDFGIIPIRNHARRANISSAGVAISNSARYRDRLLDWLRQEATTGGPGRLLSDEWASFRFCYHLSSRRLFGSGCRKLSSTSLFHRVPRLIEADGERVFLNGVCVGSGLAGPRIAQAASVI